MIEKKNLLFGVDIPQIFPSGQVDSALVSQFVCRAEALGFDSLWVSETVFGRLTCVDPIVLLSHAAACSTGVRIGASILLTVLRHPVLLAKSLASLDHLSQGRLIVGVGLGGYTQFPFYSAFGFSPRQAAVRFEEGLSLMQALWSGEEVSFEGRFWQLEKTTIQPSPLQKPHPPLWFGAHSPAALRRAVRMGQGWMGAGAQSAPGFAEEVTRIRHMLHQETRDPGSYPISKRIYVAVDDNKSRARRRVREYFGRRLGTPREGFAHWRLADSTLRAAVFGNETECVEGLRQFTRLGIDLLVLSPICDPLAQLERLAERVLPRLRPDHA